VLMLCSCDPPASAVPHTSTISTKVGTTAKGDSSFRECWEKVMIHALEGTRATRNKMEILSYKVAQRAMGAGGRGLHLPIPPFFFYMCAQE
jgi:hypothetical protein